MLLAVTNAIVGLHREFYGRGATRGRTILQENYLVCFLDDILARAGRRGARRVGLTSHWPR
jgi:uncharacterized protein YbcI